MKPRYALMIGLAILAGAATAASTNEAAPTKQPQIDKRNTHLNVRVGELVNLETFCLPQDAVTDQLYYDRSIVPLQIPPGYSLVVTDIIAQPFCTGAPSPNARWLFILEGPQARSFTIQFKGEEVVHYPLSGGLAFTSDNVPVVRTARSPELSTGGMNIQVLGYFVKGNALAPGAARF